MEAYDNGWVKPKYPKQRLEQSVAIVGSGPAGLSAAEELNYMGYQVTVFEKSRRSGWFINVWNSQYEIR